MESPLRADSIYRVPWGVLVFYARGSLSSVPKFVVYRRDRGDGISGRIAEGPDDEVVVGEDRSIRLTVLFEAENSQRFQCRQLLVDVLLVTTDEPCGLADTRWCLVSDYVQQRVGLFVERLCESLLSMSIGVIPR